MKMITTIIKNFWEFEKEHNLFAWKIDDIYIWNLVRIPILMQITNTQMYDASFHPDTKKSKQQFIKANISGIIKAISKGALKGSKEVDYIILESGRRLLEYEDTKVCQFTHFLYLELRQNHKVQLIEKTPYSANRKNVSIDEFFTPIVLAKALIKKYTYKDTNTTLKIGKLLHENFNYKGNLEKLINRKIFYFSLKFEQYKILLKRKKPEQLYLVNGYNNMGIIAACKALNIPACEIQHGIITQYSYPYNFSHLDGKVPPYFPDKMLLWGKFWYDTANLPLKESDITLKGFEIINQNTKKYSHIEKTKNSCTCISQGMISDKMLEIIMETAKQSPDFKFYFKLHPSESINEKKYNKILSENKLTNIKIILNQIEIHHLLAISEYVVGLYSTALFEAINFDCKIMIFDLPGADYMEYLIKNIGVPLVKTPSDLKSMIEESQPLLLDKKYFFIEN